MKNIFKVTLFLVMITMAQSQSASANDGVRKSARSNGAETIDAAEAQKLISRLEEIKAMDMRKLSSGERRALRKEVKASEKRLNSGGAVYISVGAIIIIILLLLLLL